MKALPHACFVLIDIQHDCCDGFSRVMKNKPSMTLGVTQPFNQIGCQMSLIQHLCSCLSSATVNLAQVFIGRISIFFFISAFWSHISGFMNLNERYLPAPMESLKVVTILNFIMAAFVSKASVGTVIEMSSPSNSTSKSSKLYLISAMPSLSLPCHQ